MAFKFPSVETWLGKHVMLSLTQHLHKDCRFRIKARTNVLEFGMIQKYVILNLIQGLHKNCRFRNKFGMTKKVNCGSAGSGGGAVAERSEAMKRKRNHGHSDSAKCRFLPPELIFSETDSATDGGLGE